MDKKQAINLLSEIKEDIIESDNVSLDKIKALNYAIALITTKSEVEE